MSSNYINNNKVSSTDIVYDIKNRTLTKTDIEKLVSDPKIKSSFIGTEYKNKKPKTYWNKDYLDGLVTAAVAESFNRDYLLYLDEVAEYVYKSKNNKKTILLIFVIAGVLLFLYFLFK